MAKNTLEMDWFQKIKCDMLKIEWKSDCSVVMRRRREVGMTGGLFWDFLSLKLLIASKKLLMLMLKELSRHQMMLINFYDRQHHLDMNTFKSALTSWCEKISMQVKNHDRSPPEADDGICCVTSETKKRKSSTKFSIYWKLPGVRRRKREKVFR